jgi:predicted nucleic acid-binding Zn ribbon protein
VLSALPEALAIAVRLMICAVVSFFGGFWIVSAWLDRKISGREAALLLVGLFPLILLLVSLSFRGPLGILVAVVVIFGGAALIRVLGIIADRSMAQHVEERDIAKYKRALDIDPKNVGAHSLLGDVYRRTGELEQAIEHYQGAVNLDPSLKEERYWIERLEAELERRERKDLSCAVCGVARPPGAVRCPQCGRWYTVMERMSHALRVMDPARRAGWLGVGAGAAAAVVAITALAPGMMKYMAVVAIVLAPAAAVIASRASRPRGRGAN